MPFTNPPLSQPTLIGSYQLMNWFVSTEPIAGIISEADAKVGMRASGRMGRGIGIVVNQSHVKRWMNMLVGPWRCGAHHTHLCAVFLFSVELCCANNIFLGDWILFVYFDLSGGWKRLISASLNANADFLGHVFQNQPTVVLPCGRILPQM